MKFEMIQEPVIPQREKKSVLKWLGNFNNLQQCVDYYKEEEINLKDVKIEFDSYNGNESDYYFVYEVYETDEEYNKKLLNYDIQMVKYNEWYKKYEKEIKEFKEQEIIEQRSELLKEKERIQGLMDKLDELEKEDKKFNLGWYINPFIIGEVVEFTEEVKKEYSFPDGIFTICRIDLDPKNWISCHPITIWLTLIYPKQSTIKVGSSNIDGNTIVVNCSRKGTRMSNDLQKETVMFKKMEEKDVE